MIPGAPEWWSRELRPGSAGSDVKTVQRVVGAIETGLYDGPTGARVRGWQRCHGLRADGLVDKDVATAMEGARCLT